jgi:hypothetical protein
VILITSQLSLPLSVTVLSMSSPTFSGIQSIIPEAASLLGNNAAFHAGYCLNWGQLAASVYYARLQRFIEPINIRCIVNNMLFHPTPRDLHYANGVHLRSTAKFALCPIDCHTSFLDLVSCVQMLIASTLWRIL